MRGDLWLLVLMLWLTPILSPVSFLRVSILVLCQRCRVLSLRRALMSGPFRRPCLTCGDLGPPGMSRCALHTREQEAKRKSVRGATPVANKLRRTLNNLPLERCRNCALVYPVRFLRVDHIVPLIDGGADVLENLQILCKDCHGYKTRDEATARREAHYD